MDKRTERARAKHELAWPVMGTIFLIIEVISLYIFIKVTSWLCSSVILRLFTVAKLLLNEDTHSA